MREDSWDIVKTILRGQDSEKKHVFSIPQKGCHQFRFQVNQGMMHLPTQT